MIKRYDDVHHFLADKGAELLAKQVEVKTTNAGNAGTLKDTLFELPHQFFVISCPAKTVFNLPHFKTIPWWLVGEFLTEFLALNPPLMTRYREDIIKESYSLMADGTTEYCYGSRWAEFNQLDNVRKKLIANPHSKRAIIQTWMPYDSELTRSDVPCNTSYMFLGRGDRLDMTATIRSNDIFRGTRYDYALAAFMLQSMAALVGQKVGDLYFHINSLHVYERDIPMLTIAVAESRSELAISLSLPEVLDISKFWEDLRRVKASEEASYNAAFDSVNHHIAKINYSIFRDFARIISRRNAKYCKLENEAAKLHSELEDDEMKRWCADVAIASKNGKI